MTARRITRRRGPGVHDFAAALVALGLILAAGRLSADAAGSGPTSAASSAVAFCKTDAIAAPTDGHALRGRIWNAKKGSWLSDPLVLREALRSADYVLLGEIHDNAEHHRIQACLLRNAISERTQAVVFEQIRITQAATLEAYLAAPDATAAGLGPALGWDKSGWPPWAEYQPIAEVAMSNRVPIRAGDVPREAIRRVARQGADGLAPAERARLGLDAQLEPPLEAALREELVASHCNMMPASAFGGMAVAQRYRDAHLAAAMMSARGKPPGGQAVLISGNGHVRNDRAVPWHLRRLSPDSNIITVAIVEAGDGMAAAAALIPNSPDGKAAADFVIFTSVAERADPCEQMRKHFRKTAPKSSGNGSDSKAAPK